MDAYLRPDAQEASNQFGFDDAFSASHETCTESRPVIRCMRYDVRFSTGFRMVFSSRDNVGVEIDILRQMHLGNTFIRYFPIGNLYCGG